MYPPVSAPHKHPRTYDQLHSLQPGRVVSLARAGPSPATATICAYVERRDRYGPAPWQQQATVIPLNPCAECRARMVDRVQLKWPTRKAIHWQKLDSDVHFCRVTAVLGVQRCCLMRRDQHRPHKGCLLRGGQQSLLLLVPVALCAPLVAPCVAQIDGLVHVVLSYAVACSYCGRECCDDKFTSSLQDRE